MLATTMTGTRGLGLGFGVGKTFHLSSKVSYQGLLNPLPFAEDIMAQIRAAITEAIAASRVGEKNNIVNVLTNVIQNTLNKNISEAHEIVKLILALVMPDILVDRNITRLSRLLPRIIPALSNEIKQLFHNGLAKFCDNDGKRFLRSIIVSKYQLYTSANIDDLIEQKMYEINRTLSADTLHTLDPELLAYLIPAILDRMNDHDLKEASLAIAEHLELKAFLPLADKNYFIPQLHMSNDQIKVNNANKRSLQFFAKPSDTIPSNSYVHVRAGKYNLQHTHVHFEFNGEENEYDVDDEKFAGEIHNVFELYHHDSPNKIRLLAIGLFLKIADQENNEIKQLLDNINHLDEVKIWRQQLEEWQKNPHGLSKPVLTLSKKQLQMTGNYKDIFMPYLDKAIAENKLMYHNWASLRANTYGFRTCLPFILVPPSDTTVITVSMTQYLALKEIFGEMRTDLADSDKLDPIDRKAGWRKSRDVLRKELDEKINFTVSFMSMNT